MVRYHSSSLSGTALEVPIIDGWRPLKPCSRLDDLDGNDGSSVIPDENLGELRFIATVGNEESEKALKGQRVPLGSGITGLAAATREVHVGAPTFKDIHQTERLSAGPGRDSPCSPNEGA